MVQELYGCYTFLPEGDGTKVIYKLRVEPGFPLPKMIKQATNKAICTTGMCPEVCAHARACRVRCKCMGGSSVKRRGSVVEGFTYRISTGTRTRSFALRHAFSLAMPFPCLVFCVC